MILAFLLFLLFALLSAGGAAWVTYLAKERVSLALLAAVVTLLLFGALAMGLLELLRASIAT